MIKKKKRIHAVLYKYSCYMEFYIKYLEVQADIFQTEDNNKTWKNDGEDSLLCMNDGDSTDEDFSSAVKLLFLSKKFPSAVNVL